MQLSHRVVLPATKLMHGRVCYARYLSRKSTHGSNADYCLRSVQRQDYENFLWLLLLPENVRPSAIALRAFNIELATIKDVVSNKEIGKMRMRFWKESLEDMYQGNPPHQPVAEELYKAITKHKLSKQWLVRLVEERDRTLEDRPFSSLAEVEDYAEKTASSMLYLTLEILGVRNVQADHAASHIGKAQGLTTLIRAVPYHAARRNVILPQDLLLLHNVTQESVIRGKDKQAIMDVIYDIASHAHSHIVKARSLKNTVPKDGLLALLAMTPVERYLTRLQKSNFDIFSPTLQRRDTLLPLALWWRKFKRTY